MDYNSFTIRAGGLNDDQLLVAPKGKVFTGGYKAILESYTFETHWTDKKHTRRFRTLDNALKYIDKHYSPYECVECGLDIDSEPDENSCSVGGCIYLADIEIFE